jgi:hypothetical protein
VRENNGVLVEGKVSGSIEESVIIANRLAKQLLNDT